MTRPALLASRASRRRSKHTKLVNAWLEDEPTLLWAPAYGATTIVDLSGGGKSGTLVGDAVLVDSGLIVGGRAVSLDGTGDCVSSTFAPFTNGAAVTLCGLAFQSGTGTSDCIIGSSAAASAVAFQILAGGTEVRWNPQAGVATVNAWVGAWSAGTHYFELAFDEAGNAVELLIDNASKGSKEQATGFAASPGNFTLGAFNNDSAVNNPFEGKLGPVAVFPKILSTERRAAHAAALA